jgi:hypothetical protein
MKDGEPGSGLKCEFEINKIQYEQKKILSIMLSTLVHFDIVANFTSHKFIF